MEKSPDAFRTISEVADSLDVPQHVLRFWEGKFPQVKPLKRAGGRRYYRPEDIDLLRGIRTLLYGEGYTIKGVQKVLREAGIRHVSEIGRNGVKGVGRAGFGARLIRVEDVSPPTPVAMPEPSHVRIVRAPVPVLALEEDEDEELEIDSSDEDGADVDNLEAPVRVEEDENEETGTAALTEGDGGDEDDDEGEDDEEDDGEGEEVLVSGDDDEDETDDETDDDEYDEDDPASSPFTGEVEARSGAPAFGLTERQRLRLETALKELLALRDLLARYKPKAEAAE